MRSKDSQTGDPPRRGAGRFVAPRGEGGEAVGKVAADGAEGRETRRRPWQAFFEGITTSVIIVGGDLPPVCIEDPIPPLDMQAALAQIERVCPGCGEQALVGHGRRERTNQVRPVARHQRRPRTLIGRVRCTACRHTHTLLQPELGPNKRYRIEILEQVCTAVEEGETKSGASRQVGGPSLERVGAWVMDWLVWARVLIDFFKHWLLSRRTVRLPFLPRATKIAHLRQLLGVAVGASVFREANRWLSGSRDRRRPPPLLSPSGST